MRRYETTGRAEDVGAEAAEALGYGLEAADRLFAVQLSRRYKESWLRWGIGLAAEAAYARAKVGEVPGAVAALEAGRAQLLAEVLDRARVPLERLAEHGRGDLADRYRRAAGRVLQLEGMGVSPSRAPT
jgi:hypothetical protein